MIQLVAPPQTVSEMLDGHRERWREVEGLDIQDQRFL